MLALTSIGALCALALYTHAEVQQAVDLFEQLVKQCAGSGVHEGDCSWHLMVPIMQLSVASITLFIQGLVFQAKLECSGARFGQIMDPVFASVALAFICELDNKAWVLLQPLMSSIATAATGIGTLVDTAQDSLLISLCLWASKCRLLSSFHCCTPEKYPHGSSPASCRAACCCSRCCKWVLTSSMLCCLL